ncbi:MAG: hypothetical protein WAV51_00585 [Microgenomates group bacterium]
MTKLSYGIIAILLLLLTSILSFKPSVVYSQTVYPTNTPVPTQEPDSCTGSLDCRDPVIGEDPPACCCSGCTQSGSKTVKVECRPLTGGPYVNCTKPEDSCQPSTLCGPTLTWTECLACTEGSTAWTYVPQNDCGGSSCGCNERRTVSVWCNGFHCYDTCNADDQCTNECVSTPTPTPTTYYPPDADVYYGTLRARVVTATAADTSCGTIAASTNYFSGVLVNFSPYIGEERLFTGSTLSWTNVATSGMTVYGISSTPPGAYALANVCVSTNGGAYAQNNAGTLTANGVLDFVIAYLPQNGWVQTVGGDAYAASSIVSSIPSTITTYFNLAGAMGDAGMVSYGSDYDFALDYADFGETLVSEKQWLVQRTTTKTNYYEHFATQMDVAGSATPLETLVNISKPTTCTSSPCVYYANGDMTTDAASTWAIGATEQTVLFVNGNVTINNNITIASGGFFAIVASGNITLDPAVTELHGIYIASNATNNAVFSSGNGSTQLVVTGSVIADNFALERDLVSLNATAPGEIFMFNPQLLFTMPDTMKETPYVWQEVAP